MSDEKNKRKQKLPKERRGGGNENGAKIRINFRFWEKGVFRAPYPNWDDH